MWKKAAGSDQSTQALEGKEKWKLQAPTELEGNVTQIKVRLESVIFHVSRTSQTSDEVFMEPVDVVTIIEKP